MVELHLFSSVNLNNCPKMLENLTRGDYSFIVIAKTHLLILATFSWIRIHSELKCFVEVMPGMLNKLKYKYTNQNFIKTVVEEFLLCNW